MNSSPYTTWTEATPNQVIDVISQLSTLPWHAVGDRVIRHEIAGLPVESSRVLPAHTLPLVESIDFWEDGSGEDAEAVWNEVAPRVTALEAAATESWGPGRRVRCDEEMRTALDVILVGLNHSSAQVWKVAGRYVVMIAGQGDKELPVQLAFTVVPEAAVENPDKELIGLLGSGEPLWSLTFED